MKYFKMVSGVGRVEMSQKEISELLEGETVLKSEPQDRLSELENRVEMISKTIDALSKTDVFRALLALTERAENKNGAS